MKKKMGIFLNDFIKKRVIIPFWFLAIVLVIGGIFYFGGWRITYDPQLENSWNAISAVSGWVSAIVSGLAIWFAVQVPNRIADRQNDIALYEKRFSCYSIYMQYVSLANGIKNRLTMEKKERLKQGGDPAWLGRQFETALFRSVCGPSPSDILSKIMADEISAKSAVFLFSEFCDEDTISKLFLTASLLIALTESSNKIFGGKEDEAINDFLNAVENFSEKHITTMKKQLRLSA